MKTMKWLLRREFWEHKGSLFIAPLVVAGIMLAMSVASLTSFRVELDEGQSVRIADAMEVFQRLGPEKQQMAVGAVSNLYVGLAAPVLMVMAFAVFLFCVNSLYDERRDRSILFWKSLPVSDRDTVLSKALMALVVAPLAAIVIGSLTALVQVLILLAYAAGVGANFFSLVLGSPDFLLAPLRLVALLPVYALWALPTVGWLMLVSAWARSKALFWAVGLPLLAGMLVAWAEKGMNLRVGADWFWEHIVGRGLFGLLPGVWLRMGEVEPQLLLNQSARYPDLGNLLSVSWQTLAQPQMWIGALAGCAMLYGAMRLRGAKEEI